MSFNGVDPFVDDAEPVLIQYGLKVHDADVPVPPVFFTVAGFVPAAHVIVVHPVPTVVVR